MRPPKSRFTAPCERIEGFAERGSQPHRGNSGAGLALFSAASVGSIRQLGRGPRHHRGGPGLVFVEPYDAAPDSFRPLWLVGTQRFCVLHAANEQAKVLLVRGIQAVPEGVQLSCGEP